MSDEQTVDLKLTGNKEMIQKVLSLLSQLSYNGSIGHSGHWYISCDGDGSDYLKMEPKELRNPKEEYGAGEIPYSVVSRIFELKAKKANRYWSK